MNNLSTKQEREVRVARPGPFPIVGCVAALACVVFANGVAIAQPPAAPRPHLPLEALVKEYKRYGLPFPPANAQLVRINWDIYHGKEPGDQPFGLVWRIPAAKPGDRERYLALDSCGVDFYDVSSSVRPNMVDETKITPDVLRSDGYTYAEQLLTFAIQCKDRGRDDLANALYSLARKRFIETEAPESPWAGELSELRTATWYYWKKTIFERDGDRKEAFRQLTILVKEEPGLLTERNEFLLGCLEATLAPFQSKPGTVEALIDELTEYWHQPWNEPPVEPEWASYWKLAELGFDAVPALIEHLGDDRLTRAWAPDFKNVGSYDITVGHLCSRLLFDLSGGTIGGGYWEERGDRIDPDEADTWFEKAKKMGEEKWLLDHALPPEDVGEYARWRHWARSCA